MSADEPRHDQASAGPEPAAPGAPRAILRRPILSLSLLFGLALLAWFLAPGQRATSKEANAAASGPIPVGVVIVREQPVTIPIELPGRTAAFEVSDVRPQIDGLIRQRLFTEGDYVREGQPLYRVDPVTYETRVASAEAGVARARATVGSTGAQARRYAELVALNAISRQQYDDALAAANLARAEVGVQQATLRAARIDLARAVVRAPISGRIGRSLYTTGALVTAGQANPLATIQRLDPIFVDIQYSSADLLQLRQQLQTGQLAWDGTAPVRLRLETGGFYPLEGRLRFADVTVDPATGSQTIRCVFPNPQGLLAPGMFVRADIVGLTQARAILIPQSAVSRDPRGRATVQVVGRTNRVEVRPVLVDRAIGASWLVTGGLRPGERVIVEGGMMLRSGASVAPQPWSGEAAARASGR